MKAVYILQQTFSVPGRKTGLIGVYSTREKAEAAMKRLLSQPGFRELKGCLTISTCTVDGDSRAEDFAEDTCNTAWSVWRQDDNGHVFLVQDGLAEAEALRLVREYEGKGHKQVYWATVNC